MRKTSLANAKTHLSELVDAAEHRGQRILILRHGKPAAAIVPANVVAPVSKLLSAAEAKALLDRLTSSALAEPLESIEESLGRRRLDRV